MHNNNNAAFPKRIAATTGLLIDLDFEAQTASPNRRLCDADEVVYATSQGSYQNLTNGHVLLRHRSVPKLEEYDGAGGVVMRARFGHDNILMSYGAFRGAWSGNRLRNRVFTLILQNLILALNKYAYMLVRMGRSTCSPGRFTLEMRKTSCKKRRLRLIMASRRRFNFRRLVTILWSKRSKARIVPSLRCFKLMQVVRGRKQIAMCLSLLILDSKMQCKLYDGYESWLRDARLFSGYIYHHQRCHHRLNKSPGYCPALFVPETQSLRKSLHPVDWVVSLRSCWAFVLPRGSQVRPT